MEPVPLRVLDFHTMGFPVGMLVRRSDHYQREFCAKGKPQVGILVAFEVYTNSQGLPIVWPVVAWEGSRTGPKLCHPALVDTHRAADRKRALYREVVD